MNADRQNETCLVNPNNATDVNADRTCRDSPILGQLPRGQTEIALRVSNARLGSKYSLLILPPGAMGEPAQSFVQEFRRVGLVGIPEPTFVPANQPARIPAESEDDFFAYLFPVEIGNPPSIDFLEQWNSLVAEGERLKKLLGAYRSKFKIVIGEPGSQVTSCKPELSAYALEACAAYESGNASKEDFKKLDANTATYFDEAAKLNVSVPELFSSGSRLRPAVDAYEEDRSTLFSNVRNAMAVIQDVRNWNTPDEARIAIRRHLENTRATKPDLIARELNRTVETYLAALTDSGSGLSKRLETLCAAIKALGDPKTAPISLAQDQRDLDDSLRTEIPALLKSLNADLRRLALDTNEIQQSSAQLSCEIYQLPRHDPGETLRYEVIRQDNFRPYQIVENGHIGSGAEKSRGQVVARGVLKIEPEAPKKSRGHK